MTENSAKQGEGRVLRRAKPLLGTLVDVAVQGHDEQFLSAAVCVAFDRVREVHRLMSFHESSSDVSRINRAAPGVPVTVDPRTADVLRLAIDLQQTSCGAFDCTIAPVLIRHGLLPAVEGAQVIGLPSNWAGDIDEPGLSVQGCVATKQRGCLIDLGGIAKGYAVDCAIDAVIALAAAGRHRLGSVLVNAGGDMRHYGTGVVKVRVRDPDDPARLTDAIDLHAGALATSSARGLDGVARYVSPIVDPTSGEPLPMVAGVTIFAPTCAVADALTKVALTMGNPDPDHPIFARYGAVVASYAARRRPLPFSLR